MDIRKEVKRIAEKTSDEEKEYCFEKYRHFRVSSLSKYHHPEMVLNHTSEITDGYVSLNATNSFVFRPETVSY